ncbi:MAG: hypothetical protein IKY66_05405 [Bacteroidales bacterium]|nr:hypothetical protein [Bacteroidales bacterium]
MLPYQEEGSGMRVRVIQAFNDKYTDEFYVPTRELDVTDDRAKEMLDAGVVEIIPESKGRKKKA